MGYLLPAEYAAFGLAEGTAAAWMTAASAMVEAFCKRPTLLLASYAERMRLGRGLQSVRLSYGPLQSVTSVKARYAPSRYEEAFGFERGFQCAVNNAFGLPGTWVDLDVSTLAVDASVGEVCLREGVLAPRYSEVEVTYTAGLAAIPDAVKVACAQIVRNAQATPALNVRGSRMDTVQMQYFSGALLDEQVRSLLRPFCAQRVG